MYSDKVSRQDLAVRILKGHFTAGRLAHTYLFTGTETSGKEELARAFAAALNCGNQIYFDVCGCLNCRKTAENNHPDVHWLGADASVRSLKIGDVRQVLADAALKPYEGQRKVFILEGAERLTIEAANALLKTLEEPPERTLFVLLVEHKAHLLETIQSRCFEIRLKPLSETESNLDPVEGRTVTLPPELETLAWEDYFKDYETASREEVKEAFDGLMKAFRNRIEYEAVTGARGAVSRYVQAIDLLVETKEAVGANVNQKLALTRLGMRLRHCFTAKSV